MPDPLYDEAIRVDDEEPARPAAHYRARRGFPLPPWALEFQWRRPTGAELEEWLAHRTNAERAAYLDDLLERHERAGAAASACAMGAHEALLEELDAMRAELEDARLAVRDAYDAGHAAGVELAAARQYVDGLGTSPAWPVVTVAEVLARVEPLEDEPEGPSCGRGCPCA